MVNDTYINLARKYRPQIISDLIGQQVLVQTLQTAFKINKIAHAFMMTGVRGVGKTTTARIIAKALNCTGVDGNGGLTLDPCGVCENCVSITKDNHIDVIELDAASKTGVDDIREIIENGQYKPVLARYKVFIIDEVHMLSKNAFNALLKTLEEPPSHLKFIFATTEIKKIPITILSRCQRFDLRRISVEMLSNHLKNICNQENITYDEESIFLLAKSAAGSVRDSLSLLDQAIVYCNGNLNSSMVQAMLGQGNKEDIYNLFLNIISNNPQNTFALLQEQYNKGMEVDAIIESLMEVCHHINCFKVLDNPIFLELPEIEMQKAKEIAEICDLAVIIKIWQILIKGLEELKLSSNQAQTFNMIITKMLLATEISNISDLITLLKNNTPTTDSSLNNNGEEKKKITLPSQNNNNQPHKVISDTEIVSTPSDLAKNSEISSHNLHTNQTINDASTNTTPLSKNEIIAKMNNILPQATYLGSIPKD